VNVPPPQRRPRVPGVAETRMGTGLNGTYRTAVVDYVQQRRKTMKLKSIPLLLLLAVFMLLSLACNQKTQTSDLLTAIEKEQSDVVQELLKSGTDPNKDAGPTGEYPLHLAVIKGNKEIVQMLLDGGATIDLKAKNDDEATPLAWAAFFGQKDMVSLLIEAGASINILDANHATPLDAAVFVWRLSIDDEKKARHLMEIITILKANGGKHADDLYAK